MTAGTYITALGTGTGQNNGGTYTVNISQQLPDTAKLYLNLMKKYLPPHEIGRAHV